MIDDMATHFQTQYLKYCDPDIPTHRLAMGLASVLEWRCWSIVWLRTPKEYREVVLLPEIRQTYVSFIYPSDERTDSFYSVLTKSVDLIDSMNSISDNKDAQKFRWHISGHTCFQAIMHILVELNIPEFQTSNNRILRSRALKVLETTLNTRRCEQTPTWKVINRIMSKCLAKNSQSMEAYSYESNRDRPV